jgi:hypothetical protein
MLQPLLRLSIEGRAAILSILSGVRVLSVPFRHGCRLLHGKTNGMSETTELIIEKGCCVCKDAIIEGSVHIGKPQSHRADDREYLSPLCCLMQHFITQEGDDY